MSKFLKCKRVRNWNEKYIDLHGYFSKKDSSIIHLEGDSRYFDFNDFYNKQDLVFIDGDHHFDSVVNDTKIAFKLIKKEKGAIIWHDYAHTPEDVRWNVLNAILEGTPKEYKTSLVAVSNTMCYSCYSNYLRFNGWSSARFPWSKKINLIITYSLLYIFLNNANNSLCLVSIFSNIEF